MLITQHLIRPLETHLNAFLSLSRLRSCPKERNNSISVLGFLVPLLFGLSGKEALSCLGYQCGSEINQTTQMSGVWLFNKNGVVQLLKNPTREAFEFKDTVGRPGMETAPGARLRSLVYVPTNQVVKSHAELEHCLLELGWKPYNSRPQNDLIQYHRSDDTVHLISLPNNFANLKSMHLYDIAVKNRSFFEVRDCTKQ